MDKHEERIQGLMRCNLSRKEAEAQANTERSIVKLTKAEMFEELCEMIIDGDGINWLDFNKKYIGKITSARHVEYVYEAVRHFQEHGTTIKTGKV